MSKRRTVFFISDRTGITAEMLGNSLLTQFEDIVFHRVTIPFVDSMEKAGDAVRQVNATAAAEGRRPIVVCSVALYCKAMLPVGATSVDCKSIKVGVPANGPV